MQVSRGVSPEPVNSGKITGFPPCPTLCTKVHWYAVNTQTTADCSAKAKSANRTQYKGMVNGLDQNNTKCTLWYTSKP